MTEFGSTCTYVAVLIQVDSAIPPVVIKWNYPLKRISIHNLFFVQMLMQYLWRYWNMNRSGNSWKDKTFFLVEIRKLPERSGKTVGSDGLYCN